MQAVGRPPAQPGAKQRDGVAEGDLPWAGKIERDTGGSAGLQEEQHRLDDIVQMHRLNGCRLGHDRQNRERRKTSQQRAAAIGGPAHHDGRTQHDPVEIPRHQGGFAIALAARKRARSIDIAADRREQDHPADTRAFTGRVERRAAGDMNALHVLTLQRTGRIDHGIDAGEKPLPFGRIGGLGNVERDVASIARCRRMTRHQDAIVPLR